ncbi:MAG: MBL fold metallo-hydrolase [Acidimicrobiia bacterium]|nr:MBL fold metallo-hydrolase [Acidimicrobiia bacterium]
MCYPPLVREVRIVKISVLATSSSGNCTFIGTSHTRILIDAGLSRLETFQRLASIGEDPASLDAILVTHEHSDHVAGLSVIARTYQKKFQRRLPVYLTHLTAPAIEWAGAEPEIRTFQAGTGFQIGDLSVSSFTIPHDAADPVGYTVEAEGIKVGLAMDLGYLPESVKYHLQGCRLIVLESNHDLDMLKVGPYPWSVKQRVMSRKGHLSNDLVSEFILDGLDREVKTLVLGHLSEHNNHPGLVRLVASQALERKALPAELVVAEPRRQGELFTY